MAISGSISQAVSSHNTLRFNWSRVSCSIADNTSTLRWELVLTADAYGKISVSAGSPWSVTVGGTAFSGKTDLSVAANSQTVLAGGTVVIPHDADGTKSFSFSYSQTFNINFASVGYVSTLKGSGSDTLDTIPRASVPAAAATTLGSACSVTWTPMAAAFRYRLSFSLGSWSYTTGPVHPNTTGPFTYAGFTIPLEVAAQLPDAPGGTMTLTLHTYSDAAASVPVGSETAAFRVTVPENESTRPSVAMALSPVNGLDAPFDALYIQNLTKLEAAFSGSGRYGASIASWQLQVGGSPYSGGLLTQTGDITVTGTATDSRGFTASVRHTVTVIPYAKPAILPAQGQSEILCARCDQGGNFHEAGTYLRIIARRSYSKVGSGGTQLNFCTLRCRVNGGGWITLLAADADTDTVDTGCLAGITLPNTASHSVELGVTDTLGKTDSVTVAVPTDQVSLHLRDGGGAGFGKYGEQDNTLDMAWPIAMNGNRITGLADPAHSTDAVPLGYLNGLELRKATLYIASGSTVTYTLPENPNARDLLVIVRGVNASYYAMHFLAGMYTGVYYDHPVVTTPSVTLCLSGTNTLNITNNTAYSQSYYVKVLVM